MALLLPNHKTAHRCIDVMLRDRPRSFHNTSLIETGISDCHKMIVSVFRGFFKSLPAKVIEYRNYRTFDYNEFLRNLDQELIKSNSYNDEQQYDILHQLFERYQTSILLYK